FISSFDDHSGGKENLTKVTDSVVDKGRSYRGLNFFAERDLHVLEVISRGEYMTFGMQGKDIRQHFENISPSAMSRIFKRLRLHGIIERVQGSYKYFATAYGKEIIAAGLTVKNLVLIPALA
ncbi:MAG: MarR family transcriptional regulator, partial [Lachnospiraceae bacterium]